MNEQHDIQMLDAVERYIRGEMNPDERLHFENLRKTNSDVDQLVVEHTLFLQQMNRFGEWQQFKTTLHDIHGNLTDNGELNTNKTGKLVYFWNRYKRVAAIAASIAGITALTFSSLVWTISPKASSADTEKLSRRINQQNHEFSKIQKDLKDVKASVAEVAKGFINNSPNNNNTPNFTPATGGTGFLIDGKGLMITNAHIVQNSHNIRVINSKGQQFNAFVVKLDVNRDVAIIKIDDRRFKPLSSLPYGIRKTPSKIAEPIFTLGYPRDEVVYGEGYLSARTGYQGDTLSIQIAIAANPGNSGGPIFNHKGEVIGILTSRETKAEGAVFAVQSKYIYQAIEEVQKNQLYRGVKLPSRSQLAGL
ncbi:MAG: serine protease [Chitinophagaceae bacterium]